MLVRLLGVVLILQGAGAIANHAFSLAWDGVFGVTHLPFLAGYRGYASTILAVLGTTLVIASARAAPTSAVVTDENERQSSTGRRTALRGIAPALGVFFLAPLVGEYLVGNTSIKEIGAVPVLGLMYGGGALLVREVARRAGRGWPTILLLGWAYGIIESGLLDGSLFNPSFQGLDAQSTPTYLPAFGISAAHAVSFPASHAIWSIGVPIAIVETLVPRQRTTPWLGRIGLAIAAIAYLLGGAIVVDWARTTEGFLPSAGQMAGAGAVAATLIGIAFAVGRSSRLPIDRPAPNPWPVGMVAFVALSLFFARAWFFVRDETWPSVTIGVALIGVMAVLVARWSRRAGWDARHRLALAGGAMLTYAWAGFVLGPDAGSQAQDMVDLVGNAIFALGALTLLAVAARTIRKERTPAVSRHDATVVGPSPGERALVWIGFPLAGATAGWLLKSVAGWVASLPWAPFQGPFKLVASVADRPLATLGALAVGAVAGLVLALLAEHDYVTVTVDDGEVALAHGGSLQRVPGPSIHAAFVDGKQLVLLGPATEELARQGGDLPDAKRLEEAFRAHGYPWRADADPYRDEYRRWVEDTPDLPGSINALLRARARALDKGDKDDAADLRRELAKLGIVVCEEDNRQYWRRAGLPSEGSGDPDA